MFDTDSYREHFIYKGIDKERARQDEIWGVQTHHPLMWFSIILEEVGEMCKAYNEYSFTQSTASLEEMMREAIEAAASICAMLECIERVGREGMVP